MKEENTDENHAQSNIIESEPNPLEYPLTKETLKNDQATELTSEKENMDKLGEIEERRKNNHRSTYCSQTYAMTKKTLIVFKRHYKTSILIFTSPILVCAILIFLQWVENTWSSNFIVYYPETQYVDKIEKCYKPKDCITIMTIILDRAQNSTNKEEVEKIMNYVADKNDLIIDKDIIISDSITNYSDFSNYLDKNKNKTYFGVVFCYDYLDTEFFGTKLNIPCRPQFNKNNEIYKFYTVVYNITNAPNDFLQMPYVPLKKDPKIIKLKLDIDNAFLEILNSQYKNYETTPKIDFTYADYPQTENRFFENYNVVNNNGSLFFLLIPLTLFVLTLIDVVREKELKLRKSLIIIGLTNGAFWTSWMIVITLFSFVLTLVFMICCYSLQWELFRNTPFPIEFILFFLFTLDLQFMAFLMSTIINSVKTAYASAFCIIILAGVTQGIFMFPFMYEILYKGDVEWTAYLFRIFLLLFCPYSHSKIYLEIATIASTNLDGVTFMNTPGRRYEYKDLLSWREGDFMLLNGHYKIPPTYQSFLWLIFDGCFYLLLAWYFDNVLEGNRGKGKSPIFFIYKIGKICGLTQKKKKLDPETDAKFLNQFNEEIRDSTFANGTFRPSVESNVDNMMENEIKTTENKNNEENQNLIQSSVQNAGFKTVIDEYNKICEEEKNNIFLDGLRIVGASKTYNISNGRKLNALENIFFDVARGELMTLLGHNGAGKTTLINALVGNIPITSGYAIINDVNITDENIKSKYKRELIGLCPQHDILWDELTPYEHIELYSIIRKYDYGDINDIAKMKMKEVNLSHVINDPVSTFSGGMKRRISILLSTIGNPNVVFLDEPSTGLDPVNRRFIWSMIKQIKKKSSVILTTHSMNEAEFLSDRICVIKKGKMQCIGTSLDLKKIYGEGYILTFVCEKNNQDKVKEIILGLSKEIKLMSSKAGSLMFTLGFDKVGELNWFIKILNKDYKDEKIKELKGLIKECGIEQTSIEEIFLKIAKEEGEDIDD